MKGTTERIESGLPEWPWLGLNRDCPVDPPGELARLRADQPVTRIRTIMGYDAWLVTRHEDARFVLSDPRFSADRRHPDFPHIGPPRPVMPGNFVHIDPPDHTRLRRIVTREFTVRAVEALRPKIRSHVDSLIDTIIADGPPADLKTSFCLPLPVRVICELLGIPQDGAEEFFVSATKAMMDAASATPDLVRQRVKEAVAYVDGLVELKEREPGPDLLSGLIRNMEPDGTLDRREMVGVVAVLMFGGYETTSNTLALTLLLALMHRDQMLRLHSEPALAKAAVEEALRYTSVLHTGLPRRATEDVTVGGQLIRAGEGVVVALSSANRDDAAFRCPDEFDLDRFAGPREAHHLAFGYGVHQCLGQMLARVQLQMALSTILDRLPTIALAKPVEEISFRHDMFIYGLHELPVTW